MNLAASMQLGLSDCMNFNIMIVFIKTSRFSIVANSIHIGDITV